MKHLITLDLIEIIAEGLIGTFSLEEREDKTIKKKVTYEFNKPYE